MHPGLFKRNSYVLCIDHFANDESFFEKRIIFFFIRERYLDITEHQVTLSVDAVLLLLIGATLSDVCS